MRAGATPFVASVVGDMSPTSDQPAGDHEGGRGDHRSAPSPSGRDRRSVGLAAAAVALAVVLAVAAVVLTVAAVGPEHAAGRARPEPFRLSLPIPPRATVDASGPHPWEDGERVRSAVDLGPDDGGAMQVSAAAAGTAHVYADEGWPACWVNIDHGDGWQTRYYHLRDVDRSIDGRHVSAGQRIGGAGQPGEDTCGLGSPDFRHVHFALFRDGRPVGLDGISIGGYTAHATRGDYCGYWTRDRDGAVLADVSDACEAVPGLTNTG